MKAVALLRKVYEWGPVLFGIAFLAPLVDQTLASTGTPAPLGLTGLQLGLAVGISLGLIAKLRGRWV